MSHLPRPFRLDALALALLGLAALLDPVSALSFGRRNQAPPIVHGGRAFEKPYRSAYDTERWKILETGIADDLTALWAVDALHAWAGGASGGLYRTRDGGATWEPLVGVDRARFVQLLWPGPEVGFALAGDGAILRSRDGGATWETVRAPGGDRVLHMDFLDERRGWAVGRRGLILHTADGGATWSRQGETLGDDLAVVQFLSEKTGWTGGAGALLGTRDGGRRWERLEPVPGWRFVSGRRAYATDGRAVFATKDGGASWRRVVTLERLLRSEAEEPGEAREAQDARGGSTDAFIAQVRFVDRYNGLADVVDGGMQRLFRTRSLGRVWKRVHAARRGGARELVTFAMSDGRNGLAIDAQGNLRATPDGARTWPIQIAGTYFDFEDVHFADRDRGWAVGAQGRIAVTEDGGRRWREASRRVGVPLHRVRGVLLAPDRGRAWAAGGEGEVLASIPEGRPWRSPWRTQRTTTRENILDLDMRRDGRGAAAGVNGLLMTTEDGGNTWRRRSTGLKADVVAVALGEGKTIHAATAAGLYRSDDGGLNLTPVDPRPPRNGGAFVDLSLPRAGRLVALQAEGRVLRRDGREGAWRAVVVDQEARLRSVQFADPEHGWILGRRPPGGSVLYASEDGGASWRSREIPERDARAVFFIDAREGWLVGPQSIHHSTDGGLNWRRQRIEGARFLRAFVHLGMDGAWAAGDNGLVARYPPPKAPPPES